MASMMLKQKVEIRMQCRCVSCSEGGNVIAQCFCSPFCIVDNGFEIHTVERKWYHTLDHDYFVPSKCVACHGWNIAFAPFGWFLVPVNHVIFVI